MKVMLLGGDTLNDVLGSVYRGFNKLGHIVSYIPIRNWRKMMRESICFEDILLATKNFSPDVILHCQPWFMPEKIIKEFKKISPFIYWTLDDPHHLIVERNYEMWEMYDGVLSCCKDAISIYEERGLPAFLFYPPVVDPSIFHSMNFLEKYNHDISAVLCRFYEEGEGLNYTGLSREIILNNATEHGSLLVVGLKEKYYSKLSKRVIQMDFIPSEFLLDLFFSCKVNLNFYPWVNWDGYLNKRTFLILASGGFQLTEAVKGIENVFEVGKHLDIYHSIKELNEKLSYWLVHEEERKKVAEQGWKFVMENYRNDIVCERLVNWLEGNIL